MEKRKQNEKGITLVALVVTIIVLVILVGVSVSTALNTGLIGNSKNAVAQYDVAQKDEKLGIDDASDVLDFYTAKTITAGGYAGDGNCKFVSDEKTAWIPAGFTVSGYSTEDSIDEGLVIYSGIVSESFTDGNIATIRGKYNQYVWIPVENPSEIYGTITEADVTLNPNQGLVVGEKYGKLYGFGDSRTGYATSATDSKITALNLPSEDGYGKEYIREPAYLAHYWADNSKYNKDAKGNKIITEAGIKNEFSRMIASVEAYGGFYIGRYELTGTKDSPTLKKGVTPLTKTNWYQLYTACQNLEQNNDKVKAHTTMIWGCQWDQAIKKSLISTTDAQTGASDFLTNAGAYGVYDVELISTSGTKAAAYNIYDMGGNVWDWVLSAVGSYSRVWCGGIYCHSASSVSASDVSFCEPLQGSFDLYGCRPQLYL